MLVDGALLTRHPADSLLGAPGTFSDRSPPAWLPGPPGPARITVRAHDDDTELATSDIEVPQDGPVIVAVMPEIEAMGWSGNARVWAYRLGESGRPPQADWQRRE